MARFPCPRAGLGYLIPRLRVATHPQAPMRLGGFELRRASASFGRVVMLGELLTGRSEWNPGVPFARDGAG